MVTDEMLTLPGVGTLVPPRKPVPGFLQFCNAVLVLTSTEFSDWSFHGQEGTKAIAKGYFHCLYTGDQSGWDGFKFKFSLSSGVFSIDAKQQFDTTAPGFVWWFKNGVHHSGPIPSEYLAAQKSLPRRPETLMSRAAINSLRELIDMQD
jgi:hypothetical protein